MKINVIVGTFLILQLHVKHLTCRKYTFHRKYYTNFTTGSSSQSGNSRMVSPKTLSQASKSQFKDSNTVLPKKVTRLTTSQSKDVLTESPKTFFNLSTSKSAESNTPKTASHLSSLQFMNSTIAPSEITLNVSSSQLKNSTTGSPKTSSSLSTLKATPPKTTSHLSSSHSTNSTIIVTTVPLKTTSQLSASNSMNSSTVAPKTKSQLENSTSSYFKTTLQLEELKTVPLKAASHSSTLEFTNSTTIPTNITSFFQNSTIISPKTISQSSTSKVMDSTTILSTITPLEIVSHLPASHFINSTILSPKTILSLSTSQFVESKIIPLETNSHLSTSKTLDLKSIAPKTTSHLLVSQSENSTTLQSGMISNSSASQFLHPSTSHSEKFQYQSKQSNISHFSLSHQTSIAQELSTSVPTLQESAIEELIGFENLVSSPYYVDKTLLLKALFYNNSINGQLLQITMPKGFGKTTNLEMIKRFCEIEVNKETGMPITKNFSNVEDTPNYELFTREYNHGKLKISQSRNFMKEYFGKYPVIYLNFARSQVTFEPNMDGALDWLWNTISEAFIEHKYLANSSLLGVEQKNTVLNWCTNRSRKQMSTHDIVIGLLNLIDYLYTNYFKEVIVLIDEYDLLARWALESSLVEDDMRRIMDFYICIYTNALRDQPKLKFALFTGVLHIDYSGFRVALPDLVTYRFGRNNKFVEFYGFTSKEIHLQLKKFETEIESDLVSKAIKYYEGYLMMDGEKIYTPVSITRFLHQKRILNYWSEGTTITKNWPALRSFKIRMMMLHLLMDNGSAEIKNMHKLSLMDISVLLNCMDTKKQPIFSSNETSIFYNYILDLGYLRITSQNNDYIQVNIPNIETSADLKLLLDTYYKESTTGAEFQIQTDFVNSLKSISMINNHQKIQQITMNLNRMLQTMSHQYDDLQEDFKQTLKEVFTRHKVHSYEEDRIKIRTEEEKEKYGLVDFFLTNLPDIYIIIETEFRSTSWSALQKIKNNLPRIFHHIKDSSTMKKISLLLGINLDEDKVVTVSAKYTNMRHDYMAEKNYTYFA